MESWIWQFSSSLCLKRSGVVPFLPELLSTCKKEQEFVTKDSVASIIEQLGTKNFGSNKSESCDWGFGI